MSARHRNFSGELTPPSAAPAPPGRARRTPRPADPGASRGAGAPRVPAPRGPRDPRGLRGGTHPSSGTRAPFLLKATVAVALVAAVGVSMMRDHVDVGAVAGDALRLVPVTHTSQSTSQQVVHLLPAAGRRTVQATTSSRSAAARPAGMLTAQGTPKSAAAAGTTGAGRARCQVKYALTAQPDGRSSVVVTVANLATAPIDGWAVRWAAPADQELALGWGAGLARAGADAIATDAGFNRVIPVGGQVSFGFSGWNLQAPRSTEFTVNGAMCR
jgi:hypothetical protein